MTVLRRYSALLAALLLAIVALQLLDMGLCCEVRPPAQSSVESKALVISENSASNDLLTSDEEAGERNEATQPDCLCHFVFVSTSTDSVLSAFLVPISPIAEVQDSLYSTRLSPPGHIPLA